MKIPLVAIRLIFFFINSAFFTTLTFFQFIFPSGIRHRYNGVLMRGWAWCSRYIFGLRVVVLGHKPAIHPGSLIISNHLSYWDIFALGSLYPAVFLSKAEIRTMPIVGLGAKLAGVVFVDRASAKSGATSIRETAKSLRDGRIVIAFPEGTTSSEEKIRPFKDGIFRAAVNKDGKHIHIYPAAVWYSDFETDTWGKVPMGKHFLRSGGKLWRTVYVHFAHEIKEKFDTPDELKAVTHKAIVESFDYLREKLAHKKLKKQT